MLSCSRSPSTRKNVSFASEHPASNTIGNPKLAPVAFAPPSSTSVGFVVATTGLYRGQPNVCKPLAGSLAKATQALWTYLLKAISLAVGGIWLSPDTLKVPKTIGISELWNARNVGKVLMSGKTAERKL